MTRPFGALVSRAVRFTHVAVTPFASLPTLPDSPGLPKRVVGPCWRSQLTCRRRAGTYIYLQAYCILPNFVGAPVMSSTTGQWDTTVASPNRLFWWNERKGVEAEYLGGRLISKTNPPPDIKRGCKKSRVYNTVFVLPLLMFSLT